MILVLTEPSMLGAVEYSESRKKHKSQVPEALGFRV